MPCGSDGLYEGVADGDLTPSFAPLPKMMTIWEALLRLWHDFPRVAWCVLYLADILTAVVLPILAMFAVYLLALKLVSSLPNKASVARQRAACFTFPGIQSGDSLDTVSEVLVPKEQERGGCWLTSRRY